MRACAAARSSRCTRVVRSSTLPASRSRTSRADSTVSLHLVLRDSATASRCARCRAMVRACSISLLAPSLQRFELLLQVPVLFSQGLEFRFRMCQSRLPGIVESLLSFPRARLPACPAPAAWTLYFPRPWRLAVGGRRSVPDLRSRSARMDSICSSSEAVSAVSAPSPDAHCRTNSSRSRSPRLDPSCRSSRCSSRLALGYECVLIRDRRGPLVFLLRCASQTVSLGQFRLAGAALRDDLVQVVDLRGVGTARWSRRPTPFAAARRSDGSRGVPPCTSI